MSLNGWLTVAEEVARKVLRDAGVTPVIRAGTVVSRNPDSNEASVVFDGDAGQVMKVKCMTSVEVYPNDRVTLVAVKTPRSTEWLIAGTFGVANGSRGMLLNGWAGGGGSTSSSSFADMPDSPNITVSKRYASSFFKVDMRVTSFVGTAAVAGAFGVFIDSIDYEVIKPHVQNVINSHIASTGIMDCAQGIPAGDYVVTARWRRTGAAGNLTVDNNDRLTVEITERR